VDAGFPLKAKRSNNIHCGNCAWSSMDEGSKQKATNTGSNSIATEAVTADDDDDEVLSSPEVELVELVPDDEDDDEEGVPLLLSDDFVPQQRSKKKKKKKKKKSKKKKQKPPKTRTIIMVGLLLVVWIGYRFLHRKTIKKEVGDGDESTQLSSFSSSSSSSSSAPTTSMPTASPTPYVRTIAPGDEPRPQPVFLFQYHKTGHAIDFQYRKAVNHVAINNFKAKYTFGDDDTNEWKITKELVTSKYISTKNTVSRTNEPSGCTALNDGWKHDYLQSMPPAPAIFCL